MTTFSLFLLFWVQSVSPMFACLGRYDHLGLWSYTWKQTNNKRKTCFFLPQQPLLLFIWGNFVKFSSIYVGMSPGKDFGHLFFLTESHNTFLTCMSSSNILCTNLFSNTEFAIPSPNLWSFSLCGVLWSTKIVILMTVLFLLAHAFSFRSKKYLSNPRS